MDLMAVGCDCDVYKLSGNFVFKHYHKDKIGYALYGKRNPTEFLLSISHPMVEEVVNKVRDGFVTHYCPVKAGSFLFYDNAVGATENHVERVTSFLYEKKIRHNDITPANILYYNGNPILVDWTKYADGTWDEAWRSDILRLEGWKRVLKIKSSRWFEEGCCESWRPAIAAEIHSILFSNLYMWREFDLRKLIKLVWGILDVGRIKSVYGFQDSLIDEAMILAVSMHISFRTVWEANFNVIDEMDEGIIHGIAS